MNNEIVVLITAPSSRTAGSIGRKLVTEGLAACVNIIPRLTSIFIWQSRLCNEKESLMLVKTVRSRFRQLEKRVKQLHPYTVPEIIALPVVSGSSDYLKWVRGATR
jgi:periplasmic divalent cation tolerance protein